MNFSIESDELPDSVKPPLKWAGGKRWLVPILKDLYSKSQSKRLVEPFVGGLSVALGLLPSQALLSDINPHLINFYLQLQKGLIIENPLKHDEEFYYAARSEFNSIIQNLESNSKRAAELFYYLNRTCFNGLCRFNSKGGFNVPFGKYKSISYKNDFSKYSSVFHKWQFNCGDFETLKIEEKDFLYVDPPYDVEFTQYSKENFSWEEQIRLTKWLKSHKGPIVASNQATKRILDLYTNEGFSIQIIDAPRMISSNGDRAKAKEMLAFKNVVTSE